MGTSKSAGEMVAKLGKYQDTIPAANRKAVEAVALVVKTRILLRATPATGGDLKLSGTKNKRVGVRYKLQGERAEIKADGPMHWLEDGVKKHAIVPKAAGGSRANRSAFVANAFGTGKESLSFGVKRRVFLAFKGGGFAAYARKAGGLKAQKVWSKGIDDAREPAVKVFQAEHRTALIRSFG